MIVLPSSPMQGNLKTGVEVPSLLDVLNPEAFGYSYRSSGSDGVMPDERDDRWLRQAIDARHL